MERIRQNIVSNTSQYLEHKTVLQSKIDIANKNNQLFTEQHYKQNFILLFASFENLLTDYKTNDQAKQTIDSIFSTINTDEYKKPHGIISFDSTVANNLLGAFEKKLKN